MIKDKIMKTKSPLGKISKKELSKINFQSIKKRYISIDSKQGNLISLSQGKNITKVDTYLPKEALEARKEFYKLGLENGEFA